MCTSFSRGTRSKSTKMKASCKISKLQKKEQEMDLSGSLSDLEELQVDVRQAAGAQLHLSGAQ